MKARATASALASGQLATSPVISLSARSVGEVLVGGRAVSVLRVEPSGSDHAMAQVLHVGQQILTAGLADDLTEYLAKYPDVTAHGRGHAARVGVPAVGVRGHCASVGEGSYAPVSSSFSNQ